mmetsp:Transcript_13496/g.21534  ORF Transcript_13496/g.21534 Transcript_13496/m.21534 type:complete len:477 (+) Transcript_13496:2964-4394(+)
MNTVRKPFHPLVRQGGGKAGHREREIGIDHKVTRLLAAALPIVRVQNKLFAHTGLAVGHDLAHRAAGPSGIGPDLHTAGLYGHQPQILRQEPRIIVHNGLRPRGPTQQQNTDKNARQGQKHQQNPVFEPGQLSPGTAERNPVCAMQPVRGYRGCRPLRSHLFAAPQLQQQDGQHQRHANRHAQQPRRDKEEGHQRHPPPLPRFQMRQKVPRKRNAKARNAQHRAQQRHGKRPPGKAVGHQQQSGRIDKDKRHQRLGNAQPEGRVARLERVRSRNARRRIGGQRHGRRDVRQHSVVKDKEVGHQRLHLQLRQRGRSHRHKDDIGGGCRNTGPHDDAGNRNQDQRGKERPLGHGQQPQNRQRTQERADVRRGLHHDIAQAKADAGQRDHTNHNPNGCRRSTHRNRILCPGSKAVPQVLDAQPMGRVQKAHNHAGDDAVNGSKVRRFARQDQIHQDDKRDQAQPMVFQDNTHFGQFLGT